MRIGVIRERDIEEYLVLRVKAMGGEVRKVKWIGRRGAPDRYVMLPARYESTFEYQPARTFWVELKGPGGALEAHQAREHERMRMNGAIVHVISSYNKVDEVLS